MDTFQVTLPSQRSPSVQRVLQGLSPEHQSLLVELYQYLLPVLLLLMRPRDIMERNRTWPGVSPEGKGATRLLSLKSARQARTKIKAYATQHGEDAEKLWSLFRSYCRYGPIGLIEARASTLPSLVPEELQECADFHRLAKHPRSNAGLYIRELLFVYADDLGYQRLPKFVARYAWATDRRIERWYFSERLATEHVTKTTRRLNLDLAYPHQRWLVRIAPVPLRCFLSRRHQILVEPWLIWIIDSDTATLMGFRVCPNRPAERDIWLTFRWSIWHYDAPWWQGRGVPDELMVPSELGTLGDDISRTLTYTQTRVRHVNDADLICTSLPTDSTTGLPANVIAWLDFRSQRAVSAPTHVETLAEIQIAILYLVQDAMKEDGVIRSTPLALAEQGCSLPWSTGIAAALLLPSAGTNRICQGQVSLWGVPFDLTASGLPEDKEVEIRYNPDDARAIYVLCDRAHIVRAPARAFEHQIAWSELVDDPMVLK